MPRGTQVKRDRLAITVQRRGTSSRIALKHLSRSQLHVRSARDHTRSVGFRGRTLKTIRTEDAQGSPVLIIPEELWVLITVGGGGNLSICFWTLGQLTLGLLRPRPTFSPGCFHNGTVWMSQTLFSHPLSCNSDSVLSSHEFLIVPVSPSPLLGSDLLSKVHASVFMNMEPSLSLPLIK